MPTSERLPFHVIVDDSYRAFSVGGPGGLNGIRLGMRWSGATVGYGDGSSPESCFAIRQLKLVKKLLSGIPCSSYPAER